MICGKNHRKSGKNHRVNIMNHQVIVTFLHFKFYFYVTVQ